MRPARPLLAGLVHRVAPFGPLLVACVPALCLYAVSDQRDAAFWDTGEMQTVPWILGIAHPTGFPLFVLLGWVFSHAFAVGPVAWRLSFFSSLAMVAAGGFLYASVAAETERPWLGAAAALAFEADAVVWSRGTRAEVHALALFFCAATIYFALRFRRRAVPRDAVATVAALACAIAVHPVAIFVAPSAFLLLAANARRLDRQSVVNAVLAALASGAIYAYIPLRSAFVSAAGLDPTARLGMPAGQPFWDYAHTAEWKNFVWYVSGRQFDREAGFTAYTSAGTVLAHLGEAVLFIVHEYGFVLVVLAASGLIAVCIRDRVAGLAWTAWALLAVPFALGYTQEADQERYLLTLLFVVGALAGIGAGALADALKRMVRLASAERGIDAAAAALVCLCVAVELYWNWYLVVQNRDDPGRRFIADVVASSPSKTVIVADWTYATALAYAAYVDGTLGSRIVVAARPRDIEARYAAWSRTYCVLVVNDRSHSPLVARSLSVRPLAAGRSAPFLFEIVPLGERSRCSLRG